MIRTADPEVMIEMVDGDTTIYRRSDGVRWAVTGRCDRRGDCLIGSIASDGITLLDSVETIERYCRDNGTDRPDSPLDVPIGIGFSGCCPFEIERLASATDQDEL